MKKILLLVSLLAFSLFAKTVTVYDYNTGEFSNYDVSTTGTTTTVYDYQDSSFKTITH